MGGFQDQVVQQLMERLPRQKSDIIWEYTSMKAAREEAGFELI